MKRIHLLLPLLVLMLPLSGVQAQRKVGQELTPWQVEQQADADTSRLQVHGSIFAGFYSGFGTTLSYTGAAPTLTYQLDDRLWVSGTLFAVGGSALPSCLPWRGGQPPAAPDLMTGRTGLLAYGGSLSLDYKTKRNNFFRLNITIVDDRAGLLTPYLCSPFYHTDLFGMWGW